jgi:hypothetical protein
LAVLTGVERFAPPLVELGIDAQVGMTRRQRFDLGPEQASERPGMLVKGAVVQLASALRQVVEDQLPYSLVADLVAVDEFLQRPPSGEHCCSHRRWCAGREQAHLVQDRPGQLPGELATVLFSSRFHVQPLVA